MPVAQQHHHHLFSAIGTFLHARHPSHSNNSSPNSSVSHGPPSGSAEVPCGHGDVPLLYQAFESHLTQRLSSLLPTEDPSCFSLSSFNEYMGLLLATQTDLRPLIPPSHGQRRTMEEFLERSTKILDICRDIKDQIRDVESLQGMLQMVAPCLILKQGTAMNQGKINRARKILAQLLFLIGAEKEDDPHNYQHVEMRQSFRGRLRERLSGHSREGSPLRGRHGNQDATVQTSHGNNTTSFNATPSSSALIGQTSGNSHSHAFEAIRALQALELSLLPPKLGARDEEECFSAAIYALNVLSVFFLGTITAVFPSLGFKAHVITAIYPPSSLGWTAAFLRSQEKVQEELRARSRKRGVHAGIWELDLLFSLIKRLLELTSPECFPWSADNEDEVRRLVAQFDGQVHELERDLDDFNEQITDFYNRIVSARLDGLQHLSWLSFHSHSVACLTPPERGEFGGAFEALPTPSNLSKRTAIDLWFLRDSL
ncbi:hypothetical protein GOP47_0022588 [Adiantum capillus-veneris]|uniref:Uncharacterized protein n=1 Tax=Adiantum capillus-veneris TaxID=13818 RepID=A0A9D4Z5H0_ADICA|nr:hypothetical protein GOP47_0022588 [Adiantum capillus-veneris]